MHDMGVDGGSPPAVQCMLFEISIGLLLGDTKLICYSRVHIIYTFTVFSGHVILNCKENCVQYLFLILHTDIPAPPFLKACLGPCMTTTLTST